MSNRKRPLPQRQPLEHHTWDYVPIMAPGVDWDRVAAEDWERDHGHPPATPQEITAAAKMERYRQHPRSIEDLPLLPGRRILVYTLRTLRDAELSRAALAVVGMMDDLGERAHALLCQAVVAIRQHPAPAEDDGFSAELDLPRVRWQGTMALPRDIWERLGVDPVEVLDLGLTVQRRSELSGDEQGR